jgi:hypothetical protein
LQNVKFAISFQVWRRLGEAALLYDRIGERVCAFATWFAAGHAPGEVGSWISQIVVAVIALVAASIAYRQVKAFGALELVKFMQQDSIRKARWHVRTILANKPLSEWTDDDRRQASAVCSSFDLMGFLLRKKLAPRRAYITLYASTVQIMHHNVTEYLAHERDLSRNGPEFWKHFTWLNEQAKHIQPFPFK